MITVIDKLISLLLDSILFQDLNNAIENRQESIKSPLKNKVLPI